MIQTLSNLDFKSLSVDDRLTLISRIWNSIDDAEFTLSDAQRAELERRVAVEDAAGDQGITWPEMKRRLQERS